MVVDKNPPDLGPAREKDVVTVGVADDVDLYISIHVVDEDTIRGEIVAIGPDPQEEYNGWSRGTNVEVDQRFIRAVIRND